MRGAPAAISVACIPSLAPVCLLRYCTVMRWLMVGVGGALGLCSGDTRAVLTMATASLLTSLELGMRSLPVEMKCPAPSRGLLLAQAATSTDWWMVEWWAVPCGAGVVDCVPLAFLSHPPTSCQELLVQELQHSEDAEPPSAVPHP